MPKAKFPMILLSYRFLLLAKVKLAKAFPVEELSPPAAQLDSAS